jgi:hypothetical protein
MADILKRAGINFETVGIDKYAGMTPGGKKFYIYRACGAYGLKFTVCIEGMNTATACLPRTVIQKIKKS